MTTKQRTEKIGVQEKIDRILARLDQGEELISKKLRIGDNFCILGLFADESGLGHWHTEIQKGEPVHYYKIKPFVKNATPYGYFVSYSLFDRANSIRLNSRLVQHYGLQSAEGAFDVDRIPASIKYRMLTANCGPSLLKVNDYMIDSEYPGAEINAVLSDIIRSGAIFKD